VRLLSPPKGRVVVVAAVAFVAAAATAVVNAVDVGIRAAENTEWRQRRMTALVELENLLETACKRKSAARHATSISFSPFSKSVGNNRKKRKYEERRIFFFFP